MTEYRNEFLMQPIAAEDPFEVAQHTTMSSASSDPLEALAGLVGRGGLKTAEEAAAEKAVAERITNPNAVQNASKPALDARPAPRPVAPVVPPSAEAFDAVPEWTTATEADAPPLTFDLNAEINRQLSSTASVPVSEEPVAPVVAPLPVEEPQLGSDPVKPVQQEAADQPEMIVPETIVTEALATSVPDLDINPSIVDGEPIASGVQNAIFDTRALEEALARDAKADVAAEPAPPSEPVLELPQEPAPEALVMPAPEAVSEPGAPEPIAVEPSMAFVTPLEDKLPDDRSFAAEPAADLAQRSADELSNDLADDLASELDLALEQEMEQSLREEAFADLSASLSAPTPQDAPPMQGMSSTNPSSLEGAEALLDAFNGFDPAAPTATQPVDQRPTASEPSLSSVDELGAALSEAMADQPQEGQQSAQDFEQELARLMGQASASSPASVAPTPEMTLQSEPTAEVPPQRVPPAPPMPAAYETAAETMAVPVAPQQALASDPVLDYSDPVEEFAAFDGALPTTPQTEAAPAPIDPPALSMMERVLGSASALGFAAKGEPHNPSFDDTFSQAFDEALSADLATEMAKSEIGPATVEAGSPVGASAVEAPLVAAPPPMPRHATPAQTAPPPSAAAFGPDNAVFADLSGENLAVREEPVIAEKKGGKKVAAVIAAIAILGSVAAFGYSYLGGSSADAPTLMASTEAVKEKPEDAGGKIVPNQDQSVFKTTDGENGAVPLQEQLKDSSEKPVAIARTKAEDRTTGVDGNSAGGLVQPRRVRTVTVRPDGTIVTSAPPEGPAVDVPKVTLAPLSSPLSDTAPAANTGQDAATAFQAPAAAPSTGVTYNAPTADGAPAPDPISVASAPATTEPVSAPVQAVPTPKPQAPAPTPPADTTSASVNEEGISTGPTPPFAVQVSSQRSAEAANQTYRTLWRRYSSLLEGKDVDIRRIEISGRGVYYRVRVPAQTRGEANTLCAELKSRGGDCFVTR